MWVVVVGTALALAEEERIEVGVRRQLAGRSVGVEAVDGAADREVLLAPQREEGQIREVVAGGDAGRSEPIPDRGQRARRAAVLEAVCRGCMRVEAVGVRRPED